MGTKSAFLYVDIGKVQPVQPVYVFVFIYMSVYAVLLVKYYIYNSVILVFSLWLTSAATLPRQEPGPFVTCLLYVKIVFFVQFLYNNNAFIHLYTPYTFL